MRLGFAQFNPEFGNISSNLDKIESLLSGIEADLIVLPELCTTGYLFINRREVVELAEPAGEGLSARRLHKLCQARGFSVVYGYAESDGTNFYNSAALITPQGFQGNYRKVHLFNTEKDFFRKGDWGFRVWSVGFVKIGIMICFDWFFPEAMRVLMLRGADIVCHPANLVLPYCQQAMTTRCLENAVFAVTANRIGAEQRGSSALTYTGKSQIVDPHGDVLVQAGATTEEVQVVDIDPLRARNKAIGSRNHRIDDRSPEDYARLLE